ncbi:hypothetical protein IWW36_003434 [Coemansia brasiliensis]|uniref:Peptidase S1 domain-containing protein n=1 Tax=Coemansia brasiliensis TaxID=2650707 RepID=A0A9W8LX81_9FUNG|nr:hypothetical protein IWW36_003434 [Coemansia brasiliensis]
MLSKRIYGGSVAPEDSAPFEVSVTTWRGKSGSTCGGTLISSRHVVTAGHCILPYKESYPVDVGYNSQNKSQQTVVKATKVTIHPRYIKDSDDGRYDLAILEIPEIAFGKHAQRMPIYGSPISAGQELLAVGWGKTGNAADNRKLLRATQITVGDYKTCNAFKNDFVESNDPRVCALGKLTPGRGICGGDSGSSVSISENGQQWFVGVGSRINFFNGAGCGDRDSASFFVHVGYFLDYIAKVTGLAKEYLLDAGPEPTSAAYSTLPPETASEPTPSTQVVTVTITEYLIRTALP